MKTITTTLYFFIFHLCICQVNGQKIIHGQIKVAFGNPESVSILNNRNNKSTICDPEGNFYIEAKLNDVLLFSAVNLESHQKTILEEDLKLAVLPILMTVKNNQLNEVIITKSKKIDAYSLGIVPEKIKQRTRKERQLYTAGDFKPIHLLGILGGNLPIEPIINSINGTTKRIKKEIVIEKKLDHLEKTKNLFEDQYYTEKLKITSLYISGFQYYCIENTEFTAALKSDNLTMIQFLMAKLAVEYNALNTPTNK